MTNYKKPNPTQSQLAATDKMQRPTSPLKESNAIQTIHSTSSLSKSIESSEQSKPISLENDKNGQKQLIMAIEQMAMILRTYGKKIDDIAALAEAYVFILGDYPAHVIIEAMKKHIKQSNQLATPADIIAILNPPEPELSPAVYFNIKKKAENGFGLLDSELEYIRKFERSNIDAVRDHQRKQARLELIEANGWDKSQIQEFLEEE